MHWRLVPTIYAVDMSSMDVAGSDKKPERSIIKGICREDRRKIYRDPGGLALRDAFTGIAEELGHQYTISYRPANKSVTENGAHLKLSYRAKI